MTQNVIVGRKIFDADSSGFARIDELDGLAQRSGLRTQKLKDRISTSSPSESYSELKIKIWPLLFLLVSSKGDARSTRSALS